jgi:hypothetical protein
MTKARERSRGVRKSNEFIEAHSLGFRDTSLARLEYNENILP